MSKKLKSLWIPVFVAAVLEFEGDEVVLSLKTNLNADPVRCPYVGKNTPSWRSLPVQQVWIQVTDVLETETGVNLKGGKVVNIAIDTVPAGEFRPVDIVGSPSR